MNAFDDLLAPVSTGEFLEHYFEKKPLYIPAKKNKFKGLFNQAEFWKAMTSQDYVDSGNTKAATVDLNGQQSETEMTALGQAEKFFKDEMTLCAHSVDTVVPGLARYLEGLGKHVLVASPKDLAFNCYLSPPGKGFLTHLDDMSVWIMQIEGQKKWRYATTRIVPTPKSAMFISLDGKFATSDIPPHVSLPDQSTFEEVVLSPGDVLYLPPGTWHRAEAVDTSLALTLTMPDQPSHYFTLQLLVPLLDQYEDWSRDLPVVIRDDEPGISSIPAEIKSEASKRLAILKEVVSELDEESFFRFWCKRSTRQPRYQEIEPVREQKIQPQDILALNLQGSLNHFVGSGVDDEKILYIYYDDREAEMPHMALPWFETLRKQKEFVAESSTKWGDHPLSWEDVSAVLETFIKMGFVQISHKKNKDSVE